MHDEDGHVGERVAAAYDESSAEMFEQEGDRAPMNTREDLTESHAADTGVEQPLWLPVDPTPAPRPSRVTLDGRHVHVVPLDAAAHADELYLASHVAEKERLFLYLKEGPFPDRAAFRAHMDKCAASEDPLYFAILDAASGRPLGHATYMRIDPANRVIEVGGILFTPRLAGTTGATEAMYLMARHVFDDLGYRRYEWKCDALNAPSRRAAIRLGFVYEGTFRHHMIIKGRNRDTAWYAMLDADWPRLKAAFEQWLSPDNFDDDGRQRTSLGQRTM